MLTTALKTTLMLCVLATACSPVVRKARFVGARDKITDASLLGPFDGQVIDEATAEPVQGATVVGVWSYDKGDGFIGPHGSEVIETQTDQAGRYRIRDAPVKIRGPHVRLVAFDLVVYKRGYVGYRSDAKADGRPRTDFALRHNKVRLRKWRESDSHADHLLFLSAPPAIEQLAKWERQQANIDLYRALSGEVARTTPTRETPGGIQILDASALLTPEEVRRRTGYTEAFEIKELADLARTHFYHGVHLQAVDREEPWDVAYRVWRDPPGGLGPVLETFQATLPSVAASGEITDDTYVYETDTVRAVAFLDRDRKIGVLLTCGAEQCVDIETAIILSKFIFDNLGDLKMVDAQKPAPTLPPVAPPAPAKETP